MITELLDEYYWSKEGELETMVSRMNLNRMRDLVRSIHANEDNIMYNFVVEIPKVLNRSTVKSNNLSDHELKLITNYLLDNMEKFYRELKLYAAPGVDNSEKNQAEYREACSNQDCRKIALYYAKQARKHKW